MTVEQVAVRLDGNRVLKVVQGDITQESVVAIVNAANRFLNHGGGVAGAIARVGGTIIQRESDAWIAEHGQVPTGEAVLTRGGKLAAQYVIHVVGPVWTQGTTEPAMLRKGVQNALSLADVQGVETIALPAISSGIFGFPKVLASEVIWLAVVDYLLANEGSLREVRFCNIDELTTGLFLKQALQYAKQHELQVITPVAV